MTAPELFDLGYADPPPSPDLAARARREGRALRRRRAAMTAGAGVVAAAVAVILTVQAIGGPGSANGGRLGINDPATGTSERELSDLPVSAGTGPSMSEFSNGAEQGTIQKAVGEPIVWGTASNGDSTQAWLNADGTFCYGRGRGAQLLPAVCLPLEKLPAQGLWGSVAYQDAAAAAETSAASSGSSSEQNSSAAATLYAGIVRGPVTRVVIDLPSGPVDAKLTPASDPDLGTFYWVVSDERVPGNVRPSRTVYRGDQPVFHCEDTECLSPL